MGREESHGRERVTLIGRNRRKADLHPPRLRIGAPREVLVIELDRMQAGVMPIPSPELCEPLGRNLDRLLRRALEVRRFFRRIEHPWMNEVDMRHRDEVCLLLAQHLAEKRIRENGGQDLDIVRRADRRVCTRREQNSHRRRAEQRFHRFE